MSSRCTLVSEKLVRLGRRTSSGGEFGKETGFAQVWKLPIFIVSLFTEQSQTFQKLKKEKQNNRKTLSPA